MSIPPGSLRCLNKPSHLLLPLPTPIAPFAHQNRPHNLITGLAASSVLEAHRCYHFCTQSLIQIRPYSALQPPTNLPDHTNNILQIIPRGKAKLSNKILRRILQVAILTIRGLVLGSSEVGVRRNRCGAFETGQALFGLRLSCGTVLVAAEELVA